jgi:hypothetical protein
VWPTEQIDSPRKCHACQNRARPTDGRRRQRQTPDASITARHSTPCHVTCPMATPRVCRADGARLSLWILPAKATDTS